MVSALLDTCCCHVYQCHVVSDKKGIHGEQFYAYALNADRENSVKFGYFRDFTFMILTRLNIDTTVTENVT